MNRLFFLSAVGFMLLLLASNGSISGAETTNPVIANDIRPAQTQLPSEPIYIRESCSSLSIAIVTALGMLGVCFLTFCFTLLLQKRQQRFELRQQHIEEKHAVYHDLCASALSVTQFEQSFYEARIQHHRAIATVAYDRANRDYNVASAMEWARTVPHLLRLATEARGRLQGILARIELYFDITTSVKCDISRLHKANRFEVGLDLKTLRDFPPSKALARVQAWYEGKIPQVQKWVTGTYAAPLERIVKHMEPQLEGKRAQESLMSDPDASGRWPGTSVKTRD